MVQCFVRLCKNRSDCQNWKKSKSENNNLKITFHSFPKNATTRSLWLDILGMSSLSIPTTARICSVHFEEKSFDRSCSITRLRPNALPSRTLTIQQLSSSNSTGEFSIAEHSLMPIVQTESIDVINGSLSPMTNIFPSPFSTSKVDKTTMVSPTCTYNSPEKSKVDKATMVSPTRIYNSPEKSRLRKRIKFLEVEHTKKIRLAQQKVRRYNDQVITLKRILDTLKNDQLLNKTQVDMIHMLGEPIDVVSSSCNK